MCIYYVGMIYGTHHMEKITVPSKRYTLHYKTHISQKTNNSFYIQVFTSGPYTQFGR